MQSRREAQMFCPQCGHQQVSDEIRFCSRCGLSLGLMTDLLGKDANQLKRQKREMLGIGFMMATVLMLLNFIIVFGVVTLPHLANPAFLWIWISFVLCSFVTGGLGLANLIRGGFFKKLTERDALLRLMQAEQKRQTLAEKAKRAAGEEQLRRLVEPASVTESTTRELEAIPKPNKELV